MKKHNNCPNTIHGTDHKINLVLGQQMGKTSVYRLTSPEKLALKDYIEDGLE